MYAMLLTAVLGGLPAEERIVDPPDDSGKLYVTVIGDRSDARYLQILGWFESNLRLQGIKDQTHFTPLSIDSTMFEARYQFFADRVPCIRVQEPDGRVIYQASSANLPATADGLADEMLRAIVTLTDLMLPDEAEQFRRRRQRECPNGDCPLVRPKPEPGPAPRWPDPQPQPLGPAQPIVDTPKNPVIVRPIVRPGPSVPTQQRVPWILYGVLGLAGAGVGLYQVWRETYSPK